MMISPTRIATLLVDRVTENEESHRRRSRTNPREDEIISSSLKVIDDVCNCASFEIDSDTNLDHDEAEEFSDSEDENMASENESLDPSFDETAEAEKFPITLNFSLDYMKKVIDYYDERDSKGKRKHTWKSTQHRFRSIPHRQYLARFRHYIEQDGTKREEMQVIDDLLITSVKKLEMLFSLSTIEIRNDGYSKKLLKILFLHLKHPNIGCRSSKISTVFVQEQS